MPFQQGEPSESIPGRPTPPLVTEFEVVAEFGVTWAEAKDAAASADVARYPQWLRSVFFPAAIALGVLVVAADSRLGFLHRFEVWPFLLAGGLATVLPTLGSLLRGRDPDQWRLVISSDGLTEQRATETVTPWSRIKRVAETQEFFLFFRGRGYRYLPKRVLSDTEVLDVRRLVAAHIHEPDKAHLLD